MCYSHLSNLNIDYTFRRNTQNASRIKLSVSSDSLSVDTGRCRPPPLKE